MGLRVGIDAGGTFTDLIARDTHTGQVYSHKLASTPHNPADAIVRGIDELTDKHELGSPDIELIAHGTTVGTNTLLQRNGARIALITTKGFRDLLEIGRQTRPINYNMHIDFPPAVVPRHRRIELSERIGAGGEIVAEVDPVELEQVLEKLLGEGPEAIAVCFLFGYLNPKHEQQVKQRIASAAPQMLVSLSSEVQPEFREYERISTTVINAYLQPVLAKYLDSLSKRLAASRPKTQIAISRSNGGLMSLSHARQFPVRTSLSGPAAGVVGAIDVLRTAERPNAITFDMGGTSADVALVRSFDCGYRHKSEIGGFPIRMAVLDINTVGAGGGSIAWFDKDELLKVGPRSAGADPGPACYGLGGVEPTVTDANLVLGRLPSIGLLGGSMQLSADRAREAVAKVSEPLGLSVEQGAIGILDIVSSNMVRAIRAITVERGFDPREFSLLAFGGAGPLHARQVAIALGVTEIIVPPLPGILCAQGALASKFKEDLVRTVRQELRTSMDLDVLAQAIDALLEAASLWSRSEGLSAAPQDVSVVIEMRYVGQNFELTVPLQKDEVRRLPSLDTLRSRFFAQHDQHYGFHSSDGLIEAVNIRLTVEVSSGQADTDTSYRKVERQGIPSGTREIWFNSAPTSTPVYVRSSLVPGQKIVGPAVVDQTDTTTLLFPGDRLSVDDHRNLLIGVQV